MTGAVRFDCVKQKVNSNEKSIQIDSRMLPILNALHVGFITFTLKLKHCSENTISDNTTKVLKLIFYKGLPRRTKLIFCYA